MNYQQYKILKCINKCPDYFVPKVVIRNILNISPEELDKDLKYLKDKDYVSVKMIDNIEHYCVDFHSEKSMNNYVKSLLKSVFDKYIFTIIISAITFILGLFINN